MILYRLLTWLICIAAAPLIAWRLVQPRFGVKDRFRAPTPVDGTGPVIWLHGASNGELTAARSVITTLMSHMPGIRLIVTANTTTGRDLVAAWALPAVTAHLAPYDLAPVVRRFLDRTRPAALIVIENEIWPNRFTLAAARGVPIFMLSARLSARSAKRWALVPGLSRRLMGCIHWLGPQDAGSAARFQALGLSPARIGPQMILKSLAAPVATSALPLPHASTLLAASTHEGEDEIVLDAFLRARTRHPDLHLILAPRHPRRRNAVEAAIRARGLAFATRSRGAEPKSGTPVYLADTLGDMAHWYAGAAMCFVGGSLVDKGGHTPFEPATYGTAILHGPHVGNSAPAYAALAAAKAAVMVKDTAGLTDAICDLVVKGRAEALADAARTALTALGTADLADFLDSLDGVIACQTDQD